VYPDGTVAVDNLTLTAPNGKITVLVGPSGCGTTTSMRMINRLIEPTGLVTNHRVAFEDNKSLFAAKGTNPLGHREEMPRRRRYQRTVSATR
jgi:ABC-type multidrug transport system ATPase subunit